MAPIRDHINAFRIASPRQFTKATKLCAKCGNRVHYDDKKKALTCSRCKTTY